METDSNWPKAGLNWGKENVTGVTPGGEVTCATTERSPAKAGTASTSNATRARAIIRYLREGSGEADSLAPRQERRDTSLRSVGRRHGSSTAGSPVLCAQGIHNALPAPEKLRLPRV